MSIKKDLLTRSDGYVDNGVDCSNRIIEKWIHKEVVKKVGDGEDDFVIVEKPVLIDSYDVQKEIDKAAKGMTLREMVAEVLRTGDDSILRQRTYISGDTCGAPEDAMAAQNTLLRGQEALDSLDPALKEKGLDALAKMTKEEILEYVKSLKNDGKKKEEVKEEIKEPAPIVPPEPKEDK